jgi:hypothetical protein
MWDRVLGAALLEPETYAEAAFADSLRAQAILIVVASSLAAGIGMISGGLDGLLMGTMAGLFGWALGAFGAFWMATQRYAVPRTPGIWGSTWRVLALASTPRFFLVFTLVPGIGFLVGLAVYSWALITGFYAIRSTLELDVPASSLTALTGWVPMTLVWAIIYLLA